MFDFLTGKALMIMGTTIALMILSFALYFNYSNNKIDNLTKANTVLTANNLTLESNNAKMKAKAIELNKNLLALGESKNDIIKINEAEKNIFDNHNLKLLLQKKPKLMEKVINKAIAKRFKSFEDTETKDE